MLVGARSFKPHASLRGIDEYPRSPAPRSHTPGAQEGIAMTDGATKREDEPPDERAIEPADEHLADLEEGAGCTEIWEHLSERREE